MTHEKDEKTSPTMLLVEAQHIEGLLPPSALRNPIAKKKTMTRKQAEEILFPLLAQFPSSGWNTGPHERLAQVVTENMVRVLPLEKRHILEDWAKYTKHSTILGWIEAAASLNIDQIEWMEEETQPSPERTPIGKILDNMKRLSDDANLGDVDKRIELRSLIWAIEQHDRMRATHHERMKPENQEWAREDSSGSIGNVQKTARQLFEQVKAGVRQDCQDFVMKFVRS
ncbi:hypothetical protein J3F83DRAFT_482386 [Trichoderma novae-zelandiae]